MCFILLLQYMAGHNSYEVLNYDVANTPIWIYVYARLADPQYRIKIPLYVCSTPVFYSSPPYSLLLMLLMLKDTFTYKIESISI